jgi:hypothetical protein
MGIDTSNGFSSNADELRNASNFYHNTVIRGFQTNILNTLQTIFSVNNMDFEVDFEQLKPITVEFDSSILKEVMTQEEIRESVGLPPLEETEETVNEEANLSKLKTFNKIGTVDGKPVFSTIEEAVAHAKTLGCEGYHEHDLNGITSYMACEEHSEATDLTEVTELTKFIQEYGEDISEDWELIDEENASSEHQDFDFEKTLNEVANEKIELTSTGTALPNARSKSQDGVNKSFNDYYKVRYVYAQDNFLQNKTGDSRKFCKEMMAANKLYRKEDIIAMGSKVVNKGWGARGADTYSIWLADQHNCANSLKTNKLEFYKGGGNCHHFWLRKIFKTSLRNAKSKVDSSQLISYTKAVSEGFTPKRNDILVAKPPKRMANKGFLPK